MARPAPPSDDGSPARLIAVMVGIVGILLLGSLAWSAVGALVSAVGAAGSALSSANPPAPATLVPVAAVTPATPSAPNAVTVTPGSTPVAVGATPTTLTTPTRMGRSTSTPAPQATPTVVGRATSTPAAQAAPTTLAQTTQTPVAQATPTSVVAARNPWILLPLPEPGTKITTGQVTVEARGRGDVPITAMRLEMDGAVLPVALEQRSESTWRGSANTRVTPGEHSVRATVTDSDGRTGSFRWTFTAAPAP